MMCGDFDYLLWEFVECIGVLMIRPSFHFLSIYLSLSTYRQ